MSYFMFIDLPKYLPEFLQALKFPKGVGSPFNDITITNAIIFSELDLGKKEGFGCPDGAIYFEYKKDDKTISTMILIEVKANETYVESYNPKKEYKKGYNSTIKGQLELRWRMKELLFNECFCNDNPNEYNDEKKTYLREIGSVRDFYVEDKDAEVKPLPHDRFYDNKDENSLASWRRLIVNETGKDKDKSGVKKFIDKLQGCENEVYFLVISKDEKNPFDSDDQNKPPNSKVVFPRCFTIKKEPDIELDKYSCKKLEWENAKKQFCWLPITWIENEDPTKNRE